MSKKNQANKSLIRGLLDYLADPDPLEIATQIKLVYDDEIDWRASSPVNNIGTAGQPVFRNSCCSEKKSKVETLA